MVTGIRVLMFITESTNNVSASFVQKPPTSRAFLRKSQRSDTQGSQFKLFSSSQSVNSSHSSHTVEVKQSTSIHSVIRLIQLIRFSQGRIWSIATSATKREPSSIRLAVRIWARSRQSLYSATLLVCMIIRSCWKIYKL